MPLLVREVAEKLLPATPELAEGMANHLLTTIPEPDEEKRARRLQ